MGALPKQRVSKGRQGRRRAHHVLKSISLTSCPRCGSPVKTHHVCPNCGTYRGIAVIDIENSRR